MAVQPTPIVPEHHRHVRVALLVSTVIALGSVGAYYLFVDRTTTTPPTTTNKTVAQYIATPQAFTDFVGEITKVSGQTLTVEFGLTELDGKVSGRTYTVTIDSKTVIEEQVESPSGTTTRTTTLAEAKVGHHAHLYADMNLYPVTTFTATKLLLSK